MSDQYYTRIAGKVDGPFSHEKMLSKVRNKRLGRIHEVSLDGRHWSRADNFPELFEVILTRVKRAGTPDTVEAPPAQPAPEAEAYGFQDLDRDPHAARSMPELARGGGAGVALPDQWHYAVDGEPQGPVSLSTLKGMIANRQLQPDDNVWAEGMENWLPIDQVPGLLDSRPRAADPYAAPAYTGHPAGGQYPGQQDPAGQQHPGQQHPGQPHPGQQPGYPTPGGYPSGAQGASALAVTSMVLGILGASLLPGLASIPAVIMGHLALAEIDRNQLQGRGYAVTALILGYSVLGLLLLFLVIKLLGP